MLQAETWIRRLWKCQIKMDLVLSYSHSAPHITRSEQVGLGLCFLHTDKNLIHGSYLCGGEISSFPSETKRRLAFSYTVLKDTLGCPLKPSEERLVKKEQIKACQDPLLNIVKMLTSWIVPKTSCSLAARYAQCKNRVYVFFTFANGVFWNIRSMNRALTKKLIAKDIIEENPAG